MSTKSQERANKILELAQTHSVKEISSMLGVSTQTLYALLARHRSNARYLSLFTMPQHLPKFSKLQLIERIPIRDFDDALRAKALVETGIPKNVLAAKKLFGEAWSVETFRNLEARYWEYALSAFSMPETRLEFVSIVEKAANVLANQDELNAMLAYQPAEKFLMGLETKGDSLLMFAKANVTPKSLEEAYHEKIYWTKLIEFRLSYQNTFMCHSLITFRLEYLDTLLPTYSLRPLHPETVQAVKMLKAFAWTDSEILLHLLKADT